jgi:dienelactone hydrolase
MKIVTIILFFCASALAAVTTKTIEYKEGDTVLEGFLASPSGGGKHSGVVVVPDWMGLGDNVKMRAKMLANLGYVAFAADVYGKGVRPKNSAEASKLATHYKSDRPLLRRRMRAAFDKLAQQPNVNAKKIAVMGYCFGGTAALELARSGAPVTGVVTFHGGLSTPTPADAKNIKSRVLALHGADDPFVNAQEVAAFQKEMRDAKLDWEFIAYGNAVHAFTIKEAGNDNSKGAAYNEKADKRSWQEMKRFFKEVL